jgi:uncharacterized cofD-like protein
MENLNPVSLSELPSETVCLPQEVDVLQERRIVAMGGGTGLATLLRGMRSICFPPNEAITASNRHDRLTAIVAVSDDGGSTGLLRKGYPMAACGDIRNCLSALAGHDQLLQELFQFRFNESVKQHSLGNLILTALTQIENDFCRAVSRAADMLKVNGRVLPATPDTVSVMAEYSDGSRIQGESRIGKHGLPITRVSLVPAEIRTLPETVDAINNADLIVIGPGSLYTSLIPTLLVPDITRALESAQAKIVLVMNLMTEPGETDQYTVLNFLFALQRHVPALRIDYVLINNAPFPELCLKYHARHGAVPITGCLQKIAETGCIPIMRDFLDGKVRAGHDPDKLARAIYELVD